MDAVLFSLINDCKLKWLTYLLQESEPSMHSSDYRNTFECYFTLKLIT